VRGIGRTVEHLGLEVVRDKLAEQSGIRPRSASYTCRAA
jgi:hypothetical protein